MGADLHAAVPEAKSIFEKASAVLGWDVADVCFNGPAEKLSLTSICQPAILVTSLAVVEALRAKGTPDAQCAAGLSLGEYTALAYAGALEFEQAVDLVRQRGALMQASSEANTGSMTSIIGLDLDVVEAICAEAGGTVQVANLNSPAQVVISGEIEALERAEGLASERGAKRAVRLDVAGAFHSPLMADAGEKLAEELAQVDITAPKIPVYSNVTAQAVPDSADGIREILVSQVTSRVLWQKGIEEMVGAGVREFREVGPGKVLSGLMRRIDRSVKCTPVGTAAEVDALGSGE
jgi:[acyl-carrier-protein] S-malonyltransferase